MRFLAGNTVIVLSLCQLKMRILRFVVHAVLAVLFKGVISNQINFKVSEATLSARLKPRRFCTLSDAPGQSHQA